jgi:ABC-2 type transport system permease protein
VHGPQVSGSLDRVSAVLLLWLGGQLAQGALNGRDAALRPELLALLPVDRRRLAGALLVVGMCDPALLIIAIAYAAVIAAAAGLGAAAVIVAIAGVAGLLVLTSVAVALAGGTLDPSSRRGRDLGTIVVAVAISFLAVAGTLLPGLLTRLQEGRWPALAVVVRVFPSGWPADAVGALAWPGILGRRMTLSGGTTHRAGHRRGRLLLPAPPAGAVAAKEIRLWLATGTSQLLPFAGPLTVVIIGARATNLYGNDGTSLWLTITTPRAAAADVRGRQLAPLLLTAPFAAVETVALTAWSGQHALWPWALGLLIALLGGAAGLAPAGSLVSVLPLDEGGNPTPAWSLKVHLALIVVALTAAPAAVVLTLGSVGHDSAVSWLGVAVAALTAAAFVSAGGRAAARRLQARQVGVLRVLAA